MFKPVLRAAFISLLIIPFSVQAQVDVATGITKVENGLGPKVYFAGDSLWNIQDRMAHYGVPGVTIAVIKDNKIAWTKSYGVMDKETKEPVTANTLFQAGSISKPVTTYGALKLVEMGKLALDADVNTQMHSWQLPQNEFTKQQQVTLKLLLGHMAGTSVHGFLGYSPDLPLPTLTQILNGEPPANSPAVVVEQVPGTEPRYSGGGYCIIQQMMIDAQGGATYPSIMQRLVLGPLGMSHSTYAQPLTGEQLKKAATGYLPDGSMTKGKRHTYPEMAPAGLWSTSEDLAKYVVDLQRTYAGKKGAVLSQASAGMMLTAYKSSQAGVGMFLQSNKGEPYFEHGGWDEGFSSQFIAHRDKGFGVVVLTNANQPDFIWELIRSVARADKWDGYLPTYTKLPGNAAVLETFAGRYRTNADEIVTISHQGDRLFSKGMTAEPVELFRITDSTYIDPNNSSAIRFTPAVGDGTARMEQLSEADGSVIARALRMGDAEHVPFEFLLAGRPDEALARYSAVMSADSTDYTVDENGMNTFAYEILSSGKTVLARDLFYVNMHLHPRSANVYDSYAEACLKNGEKELALVNYKKALAMAPENANAARVIAELEGK